MQNTDKIPAVDYKLRRFDKLLKEHHEKYYRKKLFDYTYKPLFSFGEMHEHGKGVPYRITIPSLSRQELSILNLFCVYHNIDYAVLPGAGKIVWFIDNLK